MRTLFFLLLALPAMALAPAELPRQGICGDPEYTALRSGDLPAMQADFRRVLFKLGLAGWNRRCDCNWQVTLFISVSQARNAANEFRRPGSDVLALAEVWYRRGNGTHAVVGAVTERGFLFWDVCAGRFVALSKKEQASIFFCKW